jgi:hypothetical protein
MYCTKKTSRAFHILLSWKTHNYYNLLYLLYLLYNNPSIIDRADAYHQFATQTALSLLISQFEVGLSF